MTEAKKNKDGFVVGSAISSEDLLKHMAAQRQKTKTVQAATKPPKKKAKSNRSKIHAGAESKA